MSSKHEQWRITKNAPFTVRDLGLVSVKHIVGDIFQAEVELRRAPSAERRVAVAPAGPQWPAVERMPTMSTSRPQGQIPDGELVRRMDALRMSPPPLLVAGPTRSVPVDSRSTMNVFKLDPVRPVVPTGPAVSRLDNTTRLQPSVSTQANAPRANEVEPRVRRTSTNGPTVFAQWQLDLLNEAYERRPFIEGAERTALANKLGVSEKVVKNW